MTLKLVERETSLQDALAFAGAGSNCNQIRVSAMVKKIDELLCSEINE